MPEQIVLLGYPVRLGAEQQEHLDGLVRELQLVSLSTEEQRSHVPERLLALVDLIATAQTGRLAGPERARDAAHADGQVTMDLRYPVRPDSRALVEGWSRMLAELDEHCRRDDLLVLARPARVVALQEWVVSEFLAQLEGQEPTAWTGPV